MAARTVMPVLLMQSSRIVAQIDIVHPSAGSAGIEALGPLHHGVAAIGEFLEAPLAAIRTGDAHGLGLSAGSVARPCPSRSEEHTSELQSLRHLVCRLLLEKKNTK